MIKILNVPVRNSGGGITQYCLQNLAFLDKNRFAFDFATRSPSLFFEDYLKSQGYFVHHLDFSIPEVRKMLSRGYDVLHLHTSFFRDLNVEDVAKEFKISKVIVHSHSTMVDESDPQKREELTSTHNKVKQKFSLNDATDFCACSDKAADWLFGEQISREKIRILKNAIDVEKFKFNKSIREKIRKEFNLDNKFVIGHIGRIAYSKNHSFLVDIFANVSKKLPDTVLLLVGDGDLRELIKEKVRRLNLQSKVLFLGYRENASDFYQAMDCFCLPSFFEGLPITLIETQAASVASIASDKISLEASITELLTYLPFDIDLWTNEILRIASEKREMIDRTEQITQAGYNIRDSIKILEEIYEQY
jgi:glycosyltransferase involved in cell wall biosynthesis